MIKNKVLIFSSDTSVIAPLKGLYDVEIVYSPKAALKKLDEAAGAVILIDFDVRELDGISLYKEIKSSAPDIPVIALSSTITIPETVEAARIGVADFIKKPFVSEKLLESVKRNFSRETPRIKLDLSFDSLWLAGGSGKIKAFLGSLELAIRGKRNLIFASEPGADVLSLAKIIHDHSGKGRKLTRIDMIPFQNEGAENIFWTVLQEALVDSDTVYFENFDSVPDGRRGSIMEYIKSRAARGGAKIIAGVREAASSGAFGEWEKINVPPLRERKEDMAALLEAYVSEYCGRYGKNIGSVSLDVLRVITGYSWPGNYRELECVMENAVLACDKECITLKHVSLGGKMVMEHLRAFPAEDLRDFKNNAEKGIINIFCKKTESEDEAANILDIPKTRVTENLNK